MFSPSVNLTSTMKGNVQNLGIVVFPTSCSPAVEKDFQRGVALLHSFAYEDATVTFTEIEKRETACGMAYWGEAMSYYDQLWEPPDFADLRRGFDASTKAASIGAKTQRERPLAGERHHSDH